MNNDSFATKLARFTTNHPLWAILFSIVLAIGFGFGGKNITMSSDYRYFFGKDNPQRLAFERLQDVYSKDDSILFAITPKDGVVYKAETLKGIRFLTNEAWKLPFSRRVDSITNFQHTESVADDLIVRDLVTEKSLERGITNEELAKVQSVSQNEPLIKDLLVNNSGSVTAVNIRFNFKGESPMEVPNTAAAARELAEKFKKTFPGHEVHLTGLAMMNNAFNEAGMKDMMTLTPLMYGIILLIMFIMLRSVSAIVATFGVIMLSVMSGMGFAGWAGIPITPPSSIAPTVIVTLAIADSVHILKSIMGFFAKGGTKQEAIIEGLRVNLKPVFLTSFTTVIGFLSLNFSDTPPFHDLGNITAVGVTGAFLYSIIFLPAMITLLPLKRKSVEGETTTWGDGLGQFIANNRFAIVLVTLGTTVFLALQIPKIKLNDAFVKYFDESISFRTDTDYVVKNLTGIYQVNYDLKAFDSQGIAEPSYLKSVEDFSLYLRSLDGVKHVNTITDIFKRLNKNMHSDNNEYYKLPESRELAAQYLLLYEMSLPYGLDLNTQIDVDKSATRVVVTMDVEDTQDFLVINNLAEEWLRKNTPKHMHTIGSSPTIMFSHIARRNVIGMFWGTLLAFSLITICMIVAIKSFKYGMISLLPNLIPAAMSFGIWSLTVGEAGFAIALVTSVTIGIVVDDTVHFLIKYAQAKKEKGMDAVEAVKYSLNNVGSALVVTSIILVIGFSVLMFSTFKVNYTLGVLSAMTIAIALLVDFTLLPAILIIMDSKKSDVRSKVMNPKNVLATIAVVVMAIGASSVVKAEDNKGLWVANQIDSINDGFVNQTADVEMVLTNKLGQTSSRAMKIKTLEVKKDGDKSLTIFNSPRDVKGTAFLSFSHVKSDDDQWLYLPALRRVKRISSNNKSGPFMGSEFAYEDLSSQEVDKYTYKYIQEDIIDGVAGHIIERYPVDKNSGYTKQIVYVDATEWRVHKIQFYDRKSELLKVLNFNKYKKYPNKKWRADEFSMKNIQTGKSTLLKWSNYRFNQDISSRDFDKNALKRIR